MQNDRQSHWNAVYSSKAETDVSWFQQTPAPSLESLARVQARRGDAIIDIGGGESRLVDSLLADGFKSLTVLDLSATALAHARARLGDRGDRVTWIAADATTWQPPQSYDVWHDRAAFHFLTAESDQQAYLDRLKQSLNPRGHVIFGTFAPDGPEKCSGLPVVRHDSDSLARLLGTSFALIDWRRHDHVTPWGAVQKFQFSTFRSNT